MQADNSTARDLRSEVDVAGLDDVLAENANAVDGLADRSRMQGSHDCFNFRKFRHLKLSRAAAHLWIVPGSWDRNKLDKHATIGKQ